MSRILPYFVARSVAHELDRQGRQPGAVFRFVAGVASLAVLGMLASLAVTALWIVGWTVGILP